MSIEEKLLQLMEGTNQETDLQIESSSIVGDGELNSIEEAKKEKEDDKSEKEEGEKEKADKVDDEPAVTIDNPIDPDLRGSDADGDGVDDSEEGEKKEVKESTDTLSEVFTFENLLVGRRPELAHHVDVLKKSNSTEDEKRKAKDEIDKVLDSYKTPDSLSEEFQEKAKALFEERLSEEVATRTEEIKVQLQEEFDNKLNEAVFDYEKKMTEKIDGYFGELSEQWIQDNELALEASMRSELTESFMNGMKDLFAKHYVDLPVEKFDIVTALEEQIQSLKESLKEKEEVLAEQAKDLNAVTRENILNETTEGMTELDSGKFRALMEDFEFDTADSYKKRANIIKESFFGVGKKETKDLSESKMELSTQPLLEEKQTVEDVKPKTKVSALAEQVRQIHRNR